MVAPLSALFGCGSRYLLENYKTIPTSQTYKQAALDLHGHILHPPSIRMARSILYFLLCNNLLRLDYHLQCLSGRPPLDLPAHNLLRLLCTPASLAPAAVLLPRPLHSRFSGNRPRGVQSSSANDAISHRCLDVKVRVSNLLRSSPMVNPGQIELPHVQTRRVRSVRVFFDVVESDLLKHSTRTHEDYRWGVLRG